MRAEISCTCGNHTAKIKGVESDKVKVEMFTNEVKIAETLAPSQLHACAVVIGHINLCHCEA